MRVIVSGSVLDDPAIEVVDIHALFGFAYRRQHILSVDPPSALERCLATLDARSSTAYRQAIDLGSRKAAMLPAETATLRVELVSSAQWDDPVAVLPLNQALAVLREPLGILVENSDNDWSFLLKVMGTSERKRMSEALKEGWAVPLHGGGTTLQSQLEARCRSPEKGLRTFVFFDSDRRHPDELDPSWGPKGKETCQGHAAEQVARSLLPKRFWMLRRRFIESYMPRPELPKGADAATHPDAVEAFYRMSQDERWYFNMKGGLEKDQHIDNKHRCRELYAKLSEADKDALRGGFGTRLANHYSRSTAEDFDWDAEARQEVSEALPRLMRLL